MISHYWFSLLWKPAAIGIATTLVFATPYILWELGQWRVGYMYRRLPLHCYARVAAPGLLALAIQMSLVSLLGMIATARHWTCTMDVAALTCSGAFMTLCVFPASLGMVWKLLRQPFSMPGDGPYVPDLHWSAGAGGHLG